MCVLPRVLALTTNADSCLHTHLTMATIRKVQVSMELCDNGIW